jgi:hypothetical protein
MARQYLTEAQYTSSTMLCCHFELINEHALQFRVREFFVLAIQYDIDCLVFWAACNVVPRSQCESRPVTPYLRLVSPARSTKVYSPSKIRVVTDCCKWLLKPAICWPKHESIHKACDQPNHRFPSVAHRNSLSMVVCC